MILFVYGTLRRGAAHPNARRLAREAVWLGAGRIRGTLWRVADYPGLVPGGGGTVIGDLYRLRSRASLDWIDRYEMCGPDDPVPPAYRRGRVAVRWRGRTVAATTYRWVAPVRGLRRVRGGDWLAQ